jgi:ABC-type phosphate transport system substrate-binding protein
MMRTILSRRRIPALMLSLLLAGAPAAALAADTLYVVVSAQSAIRALTQKDLLAIYTGRTRTWPGGEPATPFDQPRDSAARADFDQTLTGMDMARINSYWARLHFTGQVQPPPALGDDAAIIQRLRADPSAVGYLTQEPTGAAVRVVLRLP